MLFKRSFWVLVLTILVFFNLTRWHNGGFGWILFLLLLWHSSAGAAGLLVNFFHFKAGWRTRILGALLSFTLLGWLSGLAVIFYTLTAPVMAGIFFINGFIFNLLKMWAGEPLAEEEGEVVSGEPYWVASRLGFVVYGGLAAWGFLLLYHARTVENILTPWQTIPSSYIYIFFAATLLLGLLVFSSLRTGTILFLLMAHSLLLHSYLPLTHELLYGADQWRHIANEERMVQELPFKEAKLDENSQFPTLPAGRQVLNSQSNSKSQNLKSVIGQLSYGNFWGISAIISRLLSIDLLLLNRWFLPIMWSLFLPLLLFELGSCFGWKKKRSLFLVWLGFLPFAWQAGGAFTLPVNLGFLSWLLFTVLVLKRLQDSRWEQTIILLALGLFSFFGYALYALLFVISWGLAEVVRALSLREVAQATKQSPGLRSALYQEIATAFGLAMTTLLAVLIIPAIELFFGYSNFPAGIDWLTQVKQLFGNFTAWYLASGPRPHDISTGNIIFNQVPSYAFVVNVFTSWRWWLVGFMVLFIIAVSVGLFISLKKKEAAYTWLVLMWVSIMSSYIIGRYILVGEQILSRRLDNVVALLFVVLCMVFLNWLFRKERGALFSCFLVFLFSCSIIASYSLGPDTNTVSRDEYLAMKYVWSEEQDRGAHCVVAATYQLLALEAISRKEIIGGGFPINQYFAQPDLGKLLVDLERGKDYSLLNRGLELTKADRCWVVMSSKSLKEQPTLTFRLVAVWRYGNQ